MGNLVFLKILFLRCIGFPSYPPETLRYIVFNAEMIRILID